MPPPPHVLRLSIPPEGGPRRAIHAGRFDGSCCAVTSTEIVSRRPVAAGGCDRPCPRGHTTLRPENVCPSGGRCQDFCEKGEVLVDVTGDQILRFPSRSTSACTRPDHETPEASTSGVSISITAHASRQRKTSVDRRHLAVSAPQRCSRDCSESRPWLSTPKR